MVITEPQLKVFRCLLGYLGQFRSPPGLRDLARELGYSSHATVQQHVNALVELGYLERRADGGLSILVNDMTRPFLREQVDIILEQASA